MGKELHHTIPISLGWPNIKDSMMGLSTHNHRHVLHATLDIPMSSYKRLTRNYKMRYWDKIILPPDWVQFLWDMQAEFFHKINQLPLRMQQEHVKIMMWLVAIERDKFFKLTGQEFDKPKNAPSTSERVHSLHTTYIDCRKEISKEIIDIIRKELS